MFLKEIFRSKSFIRGLTFSAKNWVKRQLTNDTDHTDAAKFFERVDHVCVDAINMGESVNRN